MINTSIPMENNMGTSMCCLVKLAKKLNGTTTITHAWQIQTLLIPMIFGTNALDVLVLASATLMRAHKSDNQRLYALHKMQTNFSGNSSGHL